MPAHSAAKGPKTGQAELAEGLEEAVRWRCVQLGYGQSLTPLAEGLAQMGYQIGEDGLRRWFRGESDFSFRMIRAIDAWFAAAPRFLPGLIAEISSHQAMPPSGMAWIGELAEPDMRRNAHEARLISLGQYLRSTSEPCREVLKRHDLLGQAHILVSDGHAIRPFHLGEDIPINFAASIMFRDIRAMHGEPAFGLLLHEQMHETLQSKRINTYVITAHGAVTYRRVTVPVDDHTIVAFPLKIKREHPIYLN
ncbi:MAG: hypothetical protein KG075_18485 [Alphaproteobacteria bacterium]|nr:hypothetical protein [Alphaproteobacteria bacterium]